MQSTQNKSGQIIMTMIGLFLLAVALFLNHKHPHNEGIASLTHNSIYNLQVSGVSAVTERSTANVALSTLSKPVAVQSPSTPVSPSETTAAAAPSVASSIAPIVTVATASSSNPADRCLNIDRQDYHIAQQAYKNSYQQYKSSSKDSSAKDNAPADTNYQQYLSAIGSTYSVYQDSLVSAGCTPIKPAPVPETE